GQEAEDLGTAVSGRGRQAWCGTRAGRYRGRSIVTGDLLTVTGLTRHFPVTRGVIFRKTVGQVRAVDGIDFSLPSARTLGIVADSGCGKTTTGRMIARLDEPTSGHIVFDGRDITHLR